MDTNKQTHQICIDEFRKLDVDVDSDVVCEIMLNDKQIFSREM